MNTNKQTNIIFKHFQGAYYEPQPVINRSQPPGIQQDKQQQQRPKQPTPGQPTAPAPPPRLPVAPPVRIDTCIVGDDTTCTKEKNEVCKTSLGISSCFCRPGYGRKDEAKNCQSKNKFILRRVRVPRAPNCSNTIAAKLLANVIC